jgi:hypothetical protein
LAKGFFDIDIAAGLNGLDGVDGMLEIGRADDDGIRPGGFIHLFVVPVGGDLPSGFLLEESGRLLTPRPPDIGYGRDLKAQPRRQFEKSGDEG